MTFFKMERALIFLISSEIFEAVSLIKFRLSGINISNTAAALLNFSVVSKFLRMCKTLSGVPITAARFIIYTPARSDKLDESLKVKKQ